MASAKSKRAKPGGRSQRTDKPVPKSKPTRARQQPKPKSPGSPSRRKPKANANPKPAARAIPESRTAPKVKARAASKSASKPSAQRKAGAASKASAKVAAVTSGKASKTTNTGSKRVSVEAAQKSLRALTQVVEQANDREAEQILGDGQLEALLKAVLPARRRSAKTAYDYLTTQKRRASLMARVRHDINLAYSFPTGVNGRFISPTRVQWFYDGLTFIEGAEPFSGVVGLFRAGECRYGLYVRDAPANGSLGPREADFVGIAAAKQSFDAAAKPASEGCTELEELRSSGVDAKDQWLNLLERYPWMLGAQHIEFVRPSNGDANMPQLFALRAEDRAHDVLMMGQPSASVFGRSGRLQRSFQEALHHAEQTLSFVQRQAEYLEREFNLVVQRPRAFVIAGQGLDRTERETLRHHAETRHAELRVLTFDDLHQLALKTLAFFEPRFREVGKR